MILCSVSFGVFKLFIPKDKGNCVRFDGFNSYNLGKVSDTSDDSELFFKIVTTFIEKYSEIGEYHYMYT